MRMLFMGSPQFAVPSLEAIAERYEVVQVITQPDRRAGRGREMRLPPVKEAALRLGLDVYQPPTLRRPDAIEFLRSLQPDLAVVAAFGQILRAEMLNLPRLGCVNIHASLLPRWRGASPIQSAILNGDRETGVTIMRMDEGMDSGPLYLQRSLAITPETTGGMLDNSLSRLGAELIMQAIPGIVSGDLQPVAQDANQATYTRLLQKNDGRLRWDQPAALLERQVRAYSPWPGSFFYWGSLRIQAHQTAAAAAGGDPPGTVTLCEGYPAVQTADGNLLLQELQPAGKQRMAGDTWVRGAPDFIGAALPLLET